MKNRTMKEMNEQFKSCPMRENRYVVDGQPVIVVSHFVGQKNLNDVLYENAFDNALNDVLGNTFRTCASQ